MKLVAPPQAKKVVDRLARAGELARNVIPPARTKAEIAARAREFARWRRQQIMEQAKVVPVEPTPERLRKDGLGMSRETVGAGTATQPLRRFQTKSPVAQYIGQWGDEGERAFAMFVRDAAVIDVVRQTIDYDARGGATPGRKLGGLGSVHDGYRDALERYEWIRERMPMRFQQVADWLVLEVRSEASGRTMGWQDVGRRLFPSLKCERTSKGISIGALIMTGSLLAYLYRRYYVLSKAESGARQDRLEGRE